MVSAIASRTASAQCPASAGPPVLYTRPVLTAHRREVEQHREPAGALDESADRGATEPEDQVAFPVARNSPVFSFGGALADHDLVGQEALAAPSAGSGDAQRPSGAQADGQLASERAAPLHIQRLVDRFVGDPHRFIIGEVKAQPVGDLLRAPRPGPAPVLTAAVTPPAPAHRRPWHGDPVRPLHSAGQAILHIPPQLRVHGKPRGLRTPRPPVRMPLRGRGPVLQSAATRRGVPAQLPGDRGRRAADLTGDPPHPATKRAQDRDLLPLSER